MPDLIGQSLGRYHILEQLGEGGMAVVYKAFDTRLERNVAIKVILPGKQHSEKFLKRFELEAKALASLSHPNIVKVIDYGDQDGLPYLVMEYIPGGTLKQKLAGRAMSWQAVVQLLLPVCRALTHAHQNKIIHRDIKPSNILITQSGEPMLSDFGIAKILEAEETLDLTGTGVGVGTPEYMSPEQAQGKVVDARSDVYSLGVVFYESVTGRKPYQADTPMAVVWKLASEPLPRPRSLIAGLPELVEQMLLKALSKEAKDRYKNMNEFSLALEKLASTGTSNNKFGGVRTGWSSTGNRRPAFLVLAAIIGVALIGVVIAGFYNRKAAEADTTNTSPSQSTLPETIQVSSETMDCRDANDCVTALPDRMVYKIVVDANRKWTDTGILIRQGDLVQVTHISGVWRSAPDYAWVTGVECSNSCSDCLLTTTSEGSLVARVGNANAVCGAFSSIISATAGNLYLSFNDCPSEASCFSDNEGSLEMQVEVSSDHANSTPEQEGTYLVLEDFEDGIIQMDGFSADSDRWKIVDDGSSNKVFQVDNRDGTGTPGFSFGADGWKNYIAEYRIKYLSSTGYLGLQVRSDGVHSYIVNMGIGDLYLAYSTPDEWVRITTKAPPLQTETWHTVRVVVDGSSIKVLIDGNQWIDERDSKYEQGWLLMFAEAGMHAQIDDLHVLEIK